VAALNAASAGLTGEHDFAAYCRRKENATTVRAVSRLDWRRDPDGIVIATVAADAFCQAMVRSLVGALLPVGDGRRPATWPADMLTRRVRANEVVVAPPHGLTLVEVGLSRRSGRLRRPGRAHPQRQGFADGVRAALSIDQSPITWSRRYFCSMS
jgi:tRNA U38,U39,U40 pseudouridine synthase TruA